MKLLVSCLLVLVVTVFAQTANHLDWMLDVQSGSLLSTPAISGGSAYVCSYLQGRSPGSFEWMSRANGRVEAGPLCVDDRVIQVDHSGTVKCCDIQTGAELWRFSASDDILATPGYDTQSGSVIVGDNKGKLYRLDLVNGSVIWEIDCGVSIRSTPAISDGVILFSSNDGKYRAVSLDTGGELWMYQTGLIADSSPVVEDGVAYIAYRECFAAISMSDGSEVWKFQTDHTSYSSPVLVDELCYFADGGSAIYAMNTATGRSEWRYIAPAYGVEEVTYGGGKVFTFDENGTLYALDAFSGELLWTASLGCPNTSPAPAYANCSVFACNVSGELICFDAENGSRLWAVALGAEIASTPVAYENFLLVPMSGMGLPENYSSDSPFLINTDSGDDLAVSLAASTLLAIGSYAGSLESAIGSTICVEAGTGAELGVLNCVDIQNGIRDWWFITASSGSVPPAITSRGIAIGNPSGGIMMLDRISVQPLWFFDAPGALSTSVVEVGGSLVFGTTLGEVHCISNGGIENWVFDTDGAVFSTPVEHSSHVFFGSDDKRLYCVNGANGSLVWSGNCGARVRQAAGGEQV